MPNIMNQVKCLLLFWNVRRKTSFLRRANEVIVLPRERLRIKVRLSFCVLAAPDSELEEQFLIIRSELESFHFVQQRNSSFYIQSL